MKGRNILVVLTAVVCTVWSENESQDCNNIEMKKCLDYIQVPTDFSQFSFSVNKEVLERWCRDLNRGLQCIDSYTERCMTEEERHDFHSRLESTIQLTKSMCDAGSSQEGWLPYDGNGKLLVPSPSNPQTIHWADETTAVWSETEFQGCNNIEVKKCLSYIKFPADLGEFAVSMNKEVLDRWCRDLNRGLRCIDSYTERCMGEEERRYIHNRLDRITKLTKKRCDSGPYQKEFPLQPPCMMQFSDDHEHCVYQYKQKIEDVLAKLNDQDKETSSEDDSDLRTNCCSIHDYEDCFERTVMEKCGEQAAKYIEDVRNQNYFTIIEDYCKSYPRGSDKCQDSSASRNFKSALLLPISLAMLSLYAVRST